MIDLDLAELSWKTQGECTKFDLELMFPIGTTGPAALQIQAAKAVCAVCPVAAECLRWAEEQHEYYGVWGGLTEEERKEQRRLTQPPMKRKFGNNISRQEAGAR